MTSFTLSDNEIIPGIQTIEDGNTLTVAGGAGLTSTVSETDNLIITLDDTSVTPSTYGDATNVPQLTVDQQGRITGVTDVAISASGGSSALPAGIVQIAGAVVGTFAAAADLKYEPVVDRVWLGTGTATHDAKFHVSSGVSDGVPTLLIDTKGVSNTQSSLKIINKSQAGATKIVTIESDGSELFKIEKGGLVKLIHEIPELEVSSSDQVAIIRLENSTPLPGATTTLTQDGGNFKIENEGSNQITEMIGTYDTTLKYNIIRGEIHGGPSSSNTPTVMIQTNPGFLSTKADDAKASSDINFYVEGTPGSLGSTTVKGTSQFGGDVKVDGFVSRGGIAHLTKDDHQRIIPIASYDDGTWNPAPGVLLNGPAGDVIFDGTPLILDPNFYTFTPSSSSDFIKIKRDGKYKVSYGALIIQTYHTWAGSAYAHPSWASAYNAIAERSSIKSVLTIKRSGVTDDIDNSMSSCYMRRDWISNWCFTSSTIIDVITDDEIRLRLRPIACTPNDTVEFEVRADQCWLTIEKIQ
jgi:hypothetical protein